MPLNIIGVAQATCTKRVLLTLAELGVTDFTLTPVDFMAGEHKGPAHVAKQPFGAVPVMEDDDFTLFESRAICRYLAAKHAGQGTKLIPDSSDAKAVALFEQWASVETSNYDAYASPLVGQKVFGPMRGAQPNEIIVGELTKTFTAKLAIFEGILAKQQYMGGDEFSLIDIFYMPYTAMLFVSGDSELITSNPNLAAWWERVTARESWKKVNA